MQTIWKGSISFGLVSIPVRLVAATEEKDVRFRQVHGVDGGRVRQKRVCDAGGHEVAYADIAKGYELPSGDMVVLTQDDLEDLPVSSSKVVDVVAFVPFEQIDPTAFSRAYYLEPSQDAKPYVLLRDALERADRVALVKISIRNRERLAVLRVREGVLVLQTMMWPDEVRKPAFDFLEDEPTVRKQEVSMAESFIEAMSDDFDPEAYVDEYREALLNVVQAKVDGAEIVKAPEVEAEEGKVVDLMEALRRSVDEAKKKRAKDEAA
jgi:DNA end-binding protein Ku